MIEKMVNSSKERPYVILALVGIITVSMVFGSTQITMSTEMEGFLPEDYTSVQVTQMVENNTGGALHETILIEGEDVTSASNFKKIMEFHKGIEQNPKLENYVVRVSSYPAYLLQTISDYQSLSPKGLGERIQKAWNLSKENEGIRQLISKNKEYTIVDVLVNSDTSYDNLMKHTDTLQKYTKDFDESHDDLELSNSGSLSMEEETNEMMNHDNMILIPSAIVVIILILYLAFRKISDTALPFLVLILGAVWMVGTMGLVGINFTMAFVALVPVILGVGIDYTIHMLNRYYEERGKGVAVGESAVRSVRTVGIAVALTAITTIVGFASFGVSDMPPIRDFGVLAGAGVFYIFGLATTMLPALLVVRDRRGGEKKKEERKIGAVSKVLSKIETGVQRHEKPIIAAVLVITAACVVSSFGLTTSMAYDSFLPRDAETVRTMEKIEDHFGGQSMQASVLVRGDFTSPQNLRSISEFQKAVVSDDKYDSLISDSNSIVDSIKSFTGGVIPPNSSQIESILSKMENKMPKQIGRVLIGKDKGIVYFSVQAETSAETDKAVNLIRSHVREFEREKEVDLDMTSDGEPAVGGAPTVISDIMGSIMPDMRNSIILAIILVIVVLGIVFRSIWIGLAGAIPVTLALFWEFGALRSLGWSLDIMNMMVSALAIGIGVDFSIHVTHRFREEWKEDGKSPEEAISITIQSVGRALIAAAASTIGVFFVLSFSRMPPISQFGQLAGLVILFTLIGSLIVLPPVLLAYARWKERNSG